MHRTDISNASVWCPEHQMLMFDAQNREGRDEMVATVHPSRTHSFPLSRYKEMGESLHP